MFSPSRADARGFFFGAWAKYRAGAPLTDLERLAVGIIAAHPEVHPVLADPDRTAEREWLPEQGELNPFLHLALHLAVLEQLSIDQPPGIRAEFDRLRARCDEHAALHVLLECLGEAIWQSQSTRAPLDAGGYLECIRRRS